MTTLENKIKAFIEPIINNLGYKIYDVIYEKEGKDNYLRIFLDCDLDGKNPITIQDCEKVSNAINDLLDNEDFIKSQYFLEVSSPGLERNIRSDEHLEKFLKSKVEIHLFKPINKEKIITGILKKYDENIIIIETDDNEINIEKNDIAKMKNVYNWEEN